MREKRQYKVALWCIKAFGAEHLMSREQRGLRLAEEAIEAAQAVGCDAGQLHRLIDHIYAKTPGNVEQELGGVGITLLALATACGLDADYAEELELKRIEGLPASYFSERNEAKNKAGFHTRGIKDGEGI